jgi:hypothetical protein
MNRTEIIAVSAELSSLIDLFLLFHKASIIVVHDTLPDGRHCLRVSARQLHEVHAKQIEDPNYGEVTWFDAHGNEYIPRVFAGFSDKEKNALFMSAVAKKSKQLLEGGRHEECKWCSAVYLIPHLFKARNGSYFCDYDCLKDYAS